MAQITITIPDSALPHVATAKAITEAELDRTFTNVQFGQYVLREFVVRTVKDSRIATKQAEARAETAVLDTEYPGA